MGSMPSPSSDEYVHKSRHCTIYFPLTHILPCIADNFCFILMVMSICYRKVIFILENPASCHKIPKKWDVLHESVSKILFCFQTTRFVKWLYSTADSPNPLAVLSLFTIVNKAVNKQGSNVQEDIAVSHFQMFSIFFHLHFTCSHPLVPVSKFLDKICVLVFKQRLFNW